MTVRDGNVAQAVGASVANPFIFREIDVRRGGPIDPGLDRVSAVPVEQSCTMFPDRRILAVNVMEQGVYTSAEMRCPTFEIRIAGPQLDAETVLTDPAAFAQTVTAGRDAADAWFNTAEGLQFLATARRAAPPDTLEMAPPAPRIGPQPYVVRVLSASVAPAKPSGEPWDASDYGVADPLVQIEVTQQGSGRLRTPTAQDTLTPTWDAQADMMLGSGSLLRVTVWDADAVFNDRIVSFDVPFAGAKRYVLSEPTSSLSELVIDIQPEADAATSVIPQAAAASGSH